MTPQHMFRTMIAAFVTALCAVSPVFAQTPPVGAAQSFAVLGGTAVTAAGVGSVITGDVGVSPGISITGFPAGATVVPPFSTHVNDAAAIAAQASTTTLYNTLAGTAGGTALGAELGGLTLTPGTYSIASSANIASGTTLTLTGGGVFIFKVGSALTANTLSNVLLLNGASACNVFFQITSAATLNGTTFAGNVVAQSAITLGVGAALNGRALTTSAGSVTLAGGNVIGGCSAACPTITLAPPVLPNGTVASAFNQTLVASGGSGATTFAVTSGTLPAGLTLTPAGALTGTPTTAGTFTFTIRATDATGCGVTAAFTVVIAAAPVPPPVCPAITILPASLPNGTVGVPFTQTLTGSGGPAPFTFGVTAGTLSPGLTLTSAGVLAGTPTATGTSTATIRGTAANGCFAEVSLASIIVVPVPTLPQVFFVLLAAGIMAAGYFRVRRRGFAG